MPERKPCIRCGRPIDPHARSCVYCNWDQANERLDEAALTPAPVYVPPADNQLRNRFIAAVAIGALVIALMIGSLVRASNQSEAKASQAALQTTPQDSTPRSTVTLVPVEGGDSMQSESPVTTAPIQSPSAGNVDVNGERSDATALPSEAYSAAARRAKAEREVRTNAGPIDPRTIGGSIEPRRNRSVPSALALAQTTPIAPVPHTKPIPLYQPVPAMSIDRYVSARLFLTIGSDGRVRDINVGQSIPGEMPRLIASVQNWRYKPATLNGEPVTSTLTVDINVHPR